MPRNKVAVDVTMASVAAAVGHRLRFLDLRGSRGITNAAIKSIVNMCGELRTVRLRGTFITDTAVSDLLSKCTKLVELDVRDCERVSGRWLDEFYGSAMELRSVQVLRFGGYEFRTAVGVATFDGAHGIGFLAPSRYLNQFRTVPRVVGGAGHLVLTTEQLSTLCALFSELREFDFLGGMNLDPAVDPQGMIFSRLKHLTAFGGALRGEPSAHFSAANLRHLHVRFLDVGFASWAPHFTGLTSLSIAFSFSCFETDFESMLEHLPLLESLDIRHGFQSSMRYSAAKLSVLPRLREFRADEFLAQDFKEGCPNLEALDLSLCFVDDTTCVYISQALPKVCMRSPSFPPFWGICLHENAFGWLPPHVIFPGHEYYLPSHTLSQPHLSPLCQHACAPRPPSK